MTYQTNTKTGIDFAVATTSCPCCTVAGSKGQFVFIWNCSIDPLFSRIQDNVILEAQTNTKLAWQPIRIWVEIDPQDVKNWMGRSITATIEFGWVQVDNMVHGI